MGFVHASLLEGGAVSFLNESPFITGEAYGGYTSALQGLSERLK
jgi:hypothetical protein